jgi:hypothetical protein
MAVIIDTGEIGDECSDEANMEEAGLRGGFLAFKLMEHFQVNQDSKVEAAVGIGACHAGQPKPVELLKPPPTHIFTRNKILGSRIHSGRSLRLASSIPL